MIEQRPLSNKTHPLTQVVLTITRCILPTAYCLLLSAFCLVPPAFAQSATATLSGIIVDENGAAVPAVTVTVLNVATSIKREATTNESGNFTVPLLSPGTYALTAMHDGFKAVEVRDLVLNVGDERSLRIQLKVGDVKETVNITGEAPLINESPAVGTVVDRQFVANIPLNGRSFQPLMLLTPGVTLAPGFDQSGSFSVNGQRQTANYFSVDGVAANIGIGSAGGSLANTSSGTAQGVTAVGGYNNLVSVDAVQEFRIQTSTYAPEFSNVAASSINSVFAGSHTMTAGSTIAVSNSSVNDFRLNYSRNLTGNGTVLDTFGGAIPFSISSYVPTTATGNIQFALSFNTGARPGVTAGTNATNVQRQLNLVDTLSLTHGNHQIKAGVDYRRLTPTFGPFGYQATLLPSLADITNSRASSYIIQSKPTVDLSSDNVSLFGQDTWHATTRLTLTYGLRWELNPPASFADGNDPLVIVGLDNPATASVAPRGTALYHTTYGNFAPRFGISYELRQKPSYSTILRGGIGIFYDLGDSTVGYILGGPPYSGRTSLTNVAVPLTAAQAATPVGSVNPPLASPFAFDPKLKLPYTLQWNLAVEQELGRNQTITASYVAAAGRRLLEGKRFAAPSATFTGTISFFDNLSSSNYQSMQLQFQRRLSRGVQALAAYTWAHSIDDASVDFVSGNSLTKASSDFDVRHRASGAVTFDLPSPVNKGWAKSVLRNWGLDSILNMQSSTPVNVIAASRVIDGFTQNIYPDPVAGVPLYLYGSQYPGGKAFNKAAFVAPPTTRQGTFGRNVLRGFPLTQLDMSLRRVFTLHEHLSLQGRLDVFNILNHPNFLNPNGFLTNSSFGIAANMYNNNPLSSSVAIGGLNRLYQLGGPRSLQFSLKLNF